MVIEKNNFKAFLDITAKKKLVAFGASVFLQVISDNYKELQLAEKITYITDNDPFKDGTLYEIDSTKKEIHSLQYLLNDELENIVILISSERYAYEIYQQLEAIEKLKDVGCFCLPMLIAGQVDDSCKSVKLSGEDKIPKIIHCFWFSGSEKDELSKKCIESWKKYCPDYEIREWNSENYDVTKNEYMYEAYKQKKWAYATDYARLDAVYNYGGFYFDMDLELLRNIDPLLSADCVAGFGPLRDIELAAFGAKKGCSLVKEMLDAYESRKFDANNLLLTEVQPVFMAHFMRNKGFDINGKSQNRNNCILLARDSFSPKNWFTGEMQHSAGSYGIHHCAGGWISKKDKSEERQKQMIILESIFTNN
ncbi:MAG: hypothetical protein IJE43_17265 [Alphaproteobacteria bacterium]|nr:hypothetical protein [Alphaproteobacteria bacterium]MBQ6888565.1 hypothetical protein [Lachnospiraceae bacterium]